MIESIKKYITKNLSEGERYAQLAEECSELGKAALKIRRVITQSASPTPVTIKDALDNLHEEIADVLVCCDVLPLEWAKIHDIERKKSERWVKRLMERKERGDEKSGSVHENQIVYSGRDDEIKLEPDKVYKVTKGNTDGSILTGDLIFIDSKSGALVVPSAKGWLEKDEQTQSVMDFEFIRI